MQRRLGWRVIGDAADILVPSSYGMVIYARNDVLEYEPSLAVAATTIVRQAFDVTHEQAHDMEGFWRLFHLVEREDLERALKHEVPRWLAGSAPDHQVLDDAITVASLQRGSDLRLRARDLVWPLLGEADAMN